MNTMTLDNCLCRSADLQSMYEGIQGSPWWKALASFFIIADISERTCREIRESFATCPMPLEDDGCVPKLLAAAQKIALDFSRMASNPAVLLLGQRKNMLRASENWELLAEDLAMISTKEQRLALDEFVQVARTASESGRLKDWRETDLFQ